MSKNYLVKGINAAGGKAIISRITGGGQIDGMVGKPYSLMDRLRMGGIGTPSYSIHESSAGIMVLLDLDHNTNHCKIELRPGGIIVGFRSILENYAWIVPCPRLSIFRSQGLVSLHAGEHFMRLLSMSQSKSHGAFIRRLIRLRAEATRDLFTFQ